MANQATLNAAAVSDFSSLSPSIVASLWDQTLQAGVSEREFFSMFEGPDGSNKAVLVKNKPGGAKGDTVNFTVRSPLVGDGKQGNSTLRGNEEKQNLYTYQLTLDFWRHATAVDERFTSFRAAELSSDNKADMADLTSDWMARHKGHDAMLSVVKNCAYTTSGQANNLIWAGGGSADADLGTDDLLSTATFQLARRKGIGLGLRPLSLNSEDMGKRGTYRIACVATTDALMGLASDDAWINANQLARARESGADKDNPLFNGTFEGKEYWGIAPYEYMIPEHDNPANGAIGCPLQPQALLRTATTNFNTTALAFGGSSGAGSTILYTKWFPGYDYLFTSGQTAAPDSTVYYLKIKDMPGTANAGKYEICSYTGSNNDGNGITVTRNVDGGTNTTGVHAANSLVVPCTQSGVEYAHVLFLGVGALLRSYGKDKETMRIQEDDYGMVCGVAVQSIYGQVTAKRADGKIRNALVARVALPA